jgi:hypothetical protein
MANIETLNNAYYTQFKSDVYMLARQKASLYLPHVDMTQVGGKPGERVVFQRMGEIAVSEVTDRYQELEANTLPHTARSLTLRQYHCHATLDTMDDMRMVYDPTGPYVTAMAQAIGKKMDEIIRDALIGDADDKTGASSTAMTAATDLAEITIDELIAMRTTFNDSFVMPGETINCFISGAGYKDIMALNQVISSDFRNAKPIDSGVIGSFLGVDFRYDPSMPLYTNGTSHQLIAFTRQALKVAVPMDLKISMDRIPERRNAMLMQAEFVMGAVRMEENQVYWKYLNA